MKCSIQDCDRDKVRRTYCWRHYLRFRRNGTAETGRIYHQHSKRYKGPEYNTWDNMKQRCYNPKRREYRYYGARGIQICERWLNSFNAFLEDMGEKPDPTYSIDRIDVNGNYEPDNCKWASRHEQNMNQRRRLSHVS